MKKLFSMLSIVLATSVFVVPVCQAATIKSADELIVPDKIMDDAYVLAGNGTIDGDVAGDLYIAGGLVTINGNVGQDLVVAGGRVLIRGNVTGDIRLLGGELSVYGKVGEDVAVAGGQVNIEKTAIINGDLLASAGVLNVDGQINGNLRGIVGKMNFNGMVGKDMVVTAQNEIYLDSNSKIGGNLEYSSLVEATIANGLVHGTVKFNKLEKGVKTEMFTYDYFVEKFLTFVSGLLILFLLMMFTPKFMINASNITGKYVLKSFGIGFLTIFTSLVGAIFLMLTIIGMPLALIILAGLLIIFYVSQAFVAAWLGGYFFNYKKQTSKLKLFGMMALALFIYHLLGMIPFVGWAIHLVFFLVGVGSIVMIKLEYLKFLRSKKMA